MKTNQTKPNHHSMLDVRRWLFNALFALLLLLLTLPAGVQAQFNYTTNSGTITITGYTGPGGAVTIPDTINGLPVTNIGEEAFNNQTSLISVTIGNHVTSIGDYAFSGCSRLTSVLFGNSVTWIGSAAFAYCSGLTSVTIPNSVPSIGNSAFYGCTGLINITIGTSVTYIDSWAFQHCTSLISIFIPDSVATIGFNAFYGCASLTTFDVSTLNPVYSSLEGVLFNKSQTTLILCPGGKARSYTIPNSVTDIGNRAFFGCTSLTSVTIPGSVTVIRGFAFSGCTNLPGIYFEGYAPFLEERFWVVGDGWQASPVFDGINASIYYLPGTTGWGVTYGGRPTAVWQPQMQTSDGSFGVQTNQFGFNIAWASGQVVVVEASTNLANPIWFPLQTNTLSNDTLYFSDAEWTNYPDRFYRLRSP